MRARELAAELRELALRLIGQPYESREEFTEDLKSLVDKTSMLDEALKP